MKNKTKTKKDECITILQMVPDKILKINSQEVNKYEDMLRLLKLYQKQLCTILDISTKYSTYDDIVEKIEDIHIKLGNALGLPSNKRDWDNMIEQVKQLRLKSFKPKKVEN